MLRKCLALQKIHIDIGNILLRFSFSALTIAYLTGRLMDASEKMSQKFGLLKGYVDSDHLKIVKF